MRRIFKLPGKPVFFRVPDDADDDITSEASGGGAPGGNSRSIEEVAAKYNNQVGAMAQHILDLESDNYRLRQSRRTLLAEQRALVPKGSIVLSEQDAAGFAAYQSLGTVEQLTATSKELTVVKQELDTLKKQAVLQTVAQDMGYHAQVLQDLDKQLGYGQYTSKKTLDNQGVEHIDWYVKYKDGETEAEGLVEQVFQTKFPLYVPALSKANPASVGTKVPQQIALTATQNQTVDVGRTVIDSRYGYLIKKTA